MTAISISENLHAPIPEPRTVEHDPDTAAWLDAYNAHDPDADPDFASNPEHEAKKNRLAVAAHKEQQRAAGRAAVKFWLSQRSIDAVLKRYRDKTENPKASKQDAFEDIIELALNGQQQLFDAVKLQRELSLLESECRDIATDRDRLFEENKMLRESESSAIKAATSAKLDIYARADLEANARLIRLLTTFIGGEPSCSQYPVYNSVQAAEMLQRCKARIAELTAEQSLLSELQSELEKENGELRGMVIAHDREQLEIKNRQKNKPLSYYQNLGYDSKEDYETGKEFVNQFNPDNPNKPENPLSLEEMKKRRRKQT